VVVVVIVVNMLCYYCCCYSSAIGRKTEEISLLASHSVDKQLIGRYTDEEGSF